MFKFSDLYGLAGSMLLLVFVYLLLNNWMATNTLAGTAASSTDTLLKTLQGR